jgi:hypothetical protein
MSSGSGATAGTALSLSDAPADAAGAVGSAGVVASAGADAAGACGASVWAAAIGAVAKTATAKIKPVARMQFLRS